MTDHDFLTALGIRSFPTDHNWLPSLTPDYDAKPDKPRRPDNRELLARTDRQAEYIRGLRSWMLSEQKVHTERLAQESLRADRWRIVAILCAVAFLVAVACCASR